MKTIHSCEGIAHIIHPRGCPSYLWDIFHISYQLTGAGRSHDRCCKTSMSFPQRGRLSTVTSEWWGTSELEGQYISPHQIIYCSLFCSYIYISKTAKRRVKECGNFQVLTCLLYDLSCGIDSVLWELWRKQQWLWHSFKISFTWFFFYVILILTSYSL